MKKNIIAPEMNIIRIAAKDVIATSGDAPKLNIGSAATNGMNSDTQERSSIWD